MALLRIGGFLINPKIISMVELFPAGAGDGAAERVTIYLPRTGQDGVAGIGGSLTFDAAEDVHAIRCYFNDPANPEITFVTKPEPLRAREETYELDDVPF